MLKQWFAPSFPWPTDSDNMTRQRTTGSPEIRLSSLDLSKPVGDSRGTRPGSGCLYRGSLLLTTTPTNHPHYRKQTSSVHTKLCCSTPWVPQTLKPVTVVRVHVKPILYSHGGRSCNPRESSRSLHSELAGLGPSQQWIPEREEGRNYKIGHVSIPTTQQTNPNPNHNKRNKPIQKYGFVKVLTRSSLL